MLVIIFGRAAQFILLLLVMRVATTYLPPSEMGRLSLITAATAFFALFLVNPIGMFINRRFHAWDELGRAKHYLKLHWIYLLGVCLFAALTLGVLNKIHAFGFQFNTVWLLVLVCGSLLFNTINQTAIPSLNLLELRGRFIVLTLATIGVGLASAYALVEYFAPTAEYWLLGLLIGQTVFAVIGVKLFFDKLRPEQPADKLSRSHLKLLFDFAWPVAISVGFNWLQTQGYRFFVADSLGLAALGLFVAGYGISAGLMAAFESVLTTYFQPRFYKRVSTSTIEEQSAAWNKYAGAILPSLMLVTFLLISLAPELTRFMVGPAYQSASQFVIWGVLAEGARVVAGVYSMSAHAKMKTRLLLLPNLLGAVICIVLIKFLAPGMGAHGVGLARSLAGVGMLVAMHYLMIVALDMRLPLRMLLKGTAMGAGLMLIATAGRWAMNSPGIIAAGVLIVVTGLAFLPMFYWLLYPYLPRHDKVS
ncbi:lipopolysaccharide biosynthesis protein [Polaromonas sp. P5_D5]